MTSSITEFRDYSVRAKFQGMERLLVLHKEQVEAIQQRNSLAKWAESRHFIQPERDVWPLLNPTAVFKGLLRPFLGEDLGIIDCGVPKYHSDDQMMAYVLNPDVQFRHDAVNKSVVKKLGGRENAVFVVYLRTYGDPPYREKLGRELGFGMPVFGLVCWWEWIDADENDPSLPENHQNRYQNRIET